MTNITENMRLNTPLPEWMLKQYAFVLPWALLLVGAWIIVGLFSRLALFAAGALVLSLSFGLMLLPDDVAAVQRAIEIIVVALALITVKHNILAVDNLIELALGGDRGEDERSSRKKD